MRKALGAGALALTALLLPVAPAFADHDGVHLPEGYVCGENSEPSTVTGEGPAMKKDRNGNGYVCLYTNPKSGNNRFIDDQFVGV